MRPQQPPVAAVTRFLVSLAMVASLSLSSHAQSCTGTLQSTTYTTTFSGTGNASYSVSWPQYSPPAGYSLSAAVVRSVVSITASFQITNSGSTDVSNVRPGVTGEDVLQVNGNNLTDPDGNDISTVTFLKNLTAVPVIAAGQTYAYPSTVVYNNFKMMTDSIATDNILLNDFVGTGNLNITYSNTPGYNINAAVQVTPSYTITNKISLTYYYCYTGVLAANMFTFTATRQNESQVALSWICNDDRPGRTYTVQVSGGSGTDFSDVDTQRGKGVSGMSSYAYQYAVPLYHSPRLYFRIKVVDESGNISYSPLRIVDLEVAGTGKFLVYPNPPTDFINVVFPYAGMGWQVNLLSSDGKLIQQNRYNDVGSARISFSRKLAPGVYFVRVTDLQTAKSHAASFIIR